MSASKSKRNPNSASVGTLPELTKNFLGDMAGKTVTYPVYLGQITIDVFPKVFPPSSPFSESPSSVYTTFRTLRGKHVLDLGTGTGILAIWAALGQAKHVDAVDVNPDAVGCARHNAALNRVGDRVSVWQSDMFGKIPYDRRYDLIIANLPIVDANADEPWMRSVVDPSLAYHKLLFGDAAGYLKHAGRLVLCHADLQKGGFEALEKIATANRFVPMVLKERSALGHAWRSYEFTAYHTWNSPYEYNRYLRTAERAVSLESYLRKG